MAEIKNEFNLNPDDMFDGGMLHFTDTLDKRKFLDDDDDLDDKSGFRSVHTFDGLSDNESSNDEFDDTYDDFGKDLDLRFETEDPYGAESSGSRGIVPSLTQEQHSPKSGSPSPVPQHSSPAMNGLSAAAYEALDRNCRYEVILEAATAAAQRAGDGPLTYLNKGQYYAVNLLDRRKEDIMHTTTLRVRFHDSQHQVEKNENWRIWLMQQPSRNSRPMEIDKMASIGTRNLDTSEFEAIRFQWSGARGAKILVKLNCLSTEFSRTKGVKGIHLRLQTDTEDDKANYESQYCRVKVFRDKGAQRKNRDDQKAVEKRLEKLMREDGSKTRDGMLVFTPPQPLTRFILDPESIVVEELPEEIASVLNPEVVAIAPTAVTSVPAAPAVVKAHSGTASPTLPHSSSSSSLNAPVLSDGTFMPKAKSRKHEFVDIADLELEPSLPPTVSRKKRPVLCILLKTPEDPVYNAIFLERLTAEDLRRKLAERCGLDVNAITSLCRITKKGLAVKVDDRMVENFEDEQDFVMETTFSSTDGTMAISLR